MTLNTTFRPEQVHKSAWIAPGAVVVGDVTLGENVSVWYQSVLRADTDSISIDVGTNVQDGCVLHVDPGYPLTIGKGVTVGHRAVVHGCTVGDNTLVGMGSILLNGCVIGQDSLIGAGSLIAQGKVYPDGVLLLGRPARVVRDLTPDEIEHTRKRALGYVEKLKAFKNS